MTSHTGSTRGKSLFSLFLSVVLVLGMLIPVNAATISPTDAIHASNIILDKETLVPAYVSAPAINHIFDVDGLIFVNDFQDNFTLPNTTGDAFLQTRLFPKGEARTRGANLYAYLYRVDLRHLLSAGPDQVCVSEISIPFGAVARLDYDDDDLPEDYFVISEGGAMGSISPSSVVQNPLTGLITFEFIEPFCSGIPGSSGESSFFIGLASDKPYKQVNAQLVSPAGNMSLNSRAPISITDPGCMQIFSPDEIPSPSVINFDSLPDDQHILESYSANGLTFRTNNFIEKDLSIEARSFPNVAVAPVSVGAATQIDFFLYARHSHVGFYAGNESDTAVIAHAIAEDMSGLPICTFDITLPPQSLSTFIGFYVPDYDPFGAGIVGVKLSYPGSSTRVIIDDLMFAPGSEIRTEFPRPETSLSETGPEIVIHRSDNLRFTATFNLPDPSFWMEEQDDSDMRRLRFGLPGAVLNGSLDGYPDVPFIRRLIAVPEGATALINGLSAVVARDQFLADLYPSQPSAMDEDTEPPGPNPEDWINPPFTINAGAYLTNGNFPASPYGIYPLGKMRDLNLALLVVAGGQYNPVTRRLVVFKSVDVDVTFQGGAGYFLPDYSNNPFEPSIARQYGQALNSSIVGNYLGAIPTFSTICHELIIITHPNFLAAANTLASWKIEKGISTKVVQKGDTAVGNTPAEIKAFIQNKYDTCAVRPSYVLLLGDSEYIGAFLHNYSYPYDTANSDLDYTLMTPGDTFPDLAIGRIPVDTLAQANIIVNKIIAYEQDPPDQSSFYNNVALASFFECCSAFDYERATDDRSFIETSEKVRFALLLSGKTVTRIYTDNIGSFYVPSYYRNGASLPTTIGYGSGFLWDGDTTDVINAFNNGTGLIMHRGHGGPSGWVDPSFKTTDLISLNNGNLTPVVYSVNCKSGVWDNELGTSSGLLVTDVSWIEHMLRMNGGAVSLIGDVRNSPTWANSALARGLFDATWPLTDATYGTSTVHHRLGDILNYAKLYMFAQISIPQTAGEVPDSDYEFNNTIYHVIGDPTLELWKKQPIHALSVYAVFHWGVLTPTSGLGGKAAPTLIVEYTTEGAQITILQNGQPVGRGIVSGGQALITFIADVDPGLPLQISASLDDEVSVLIGQPIFLPMIRK